MKSVRRKSLLVKRAIINLHKEIMSSCPLGSIVDINYGRATYKGKVINHSLYGDNPRLLILNLKTNNKRWTYIFPHICA